MSYEEKYLKYKNKYIKLKNQIGGWLETGSIVRTIQNSGEQEGMRLQCFWISILQYLNSNGYPRLTLRELRTNAGLRSDTEQKMFDTANENFSVAANNVASFYNLKIYVYRVSRNGEILERGDRFPIYYNADGTENIVNNPNEKIVNIAMFGLIHFELIDLNNGNEFIPAVMYKDNLTKVIKIPDNTENEGIQAAYLNLVDLTDELNKLEKSKDTYILKIKQLKNNIVTMLENTTKDQEYKLTYIRIINDQIKSWTQEIPLSKIKKIEDELSSVQLAIKLHEEDQ